MDFVGRIVELVADVDQALEGKVRDGI